MNLYTSLTLRYLKQNKRRTLVTIIGIILATALICGIGNICTSFMDYQMRDQIQSSGSFYATFTDIDKEKAEVITKSSGVSEYGYKKNLGSVILDKKNSTSLDINVFDKNTINSFQITLKKGSYPKNESELIVTQDLLNKWNKIIGDKITLNLGELIYDDMGMISKLKNSQKTTFKIVGTPDKAPYNSKLFAIAGFDINSVNKNEKFDVSICTKNPKDIYKTAISIGAQKSEQVEQRRQEMLQYLCRLTGRETESADEVRLKALRESVSQAKRLRGDLQRLHLQHQQLHQEEENCQNQMEQIDQSIAPVVAAAKEAAASKEAAAEPSASDSLEHCRQGKLRYDSLHTELQMQQELLTETLGGYSFEQLEQAVRVKNPSEPSATAISPDRQQARQQLQLVNTQLTELSAKASQLAGLRQGREESLRPSGQIQSEIQQLQQSCDRCQFELDALALAKEKLLSLGGQLHRDFAPRLNARVSQAVAKATGEKYTRVVIDQSLVREMGKLDGI